MSRVNKRLDAAGGQTKAPKSAWPTRALGDVCDVIGGGTPPKEIASYYGGTIPWATVRDMKADLIENTECSITTDAVQASATNIIRAGNVIIATRVGLGKVCILGQDTAINQDLRGIIPRNGNVRVKFLYHWLRYIAPQIVAEGSGATVQGVKLPFIKSLQMPLPTIPEQDRIVAILDEALEGIGTAKANAEKSLEDSRALFSSYLDHLKGPKRALASLVVIKTGKLDANAAVNDGIYPFFTCSREVYAINTFAFDCHAILLAGNNAVGDFNVKIYNGKFNAYQRTYVITIPDEKQLLHRYLYYQILKSMKEFKQKSVGAGTKFLKIGMIEGLEIVLPPIAAQELIVDSLDRLFQETQRLEGVIRQKQSSLEELRQSLLQNAFSGNL